LEYDAVVFEVLRMDRCSEARFLAVNMWGGVYGSLIFGTWVYGSFSHYLCKGGGRMLIQDEPSTSRDAEILQIRGCFYGKIKYAMSVSRRSYPRNDKLWNTISQISEIASTIYGSSALAD
jgi:hypothetical protein